MAEFDLARARPLCTGKIADRGVADAALASRLASFKGRIAGNYRSLLTDDIGTLSSPAWASLKIDGELWFLVLGSEEAWLANPRGTVITGDIPLIKDAREMAANLKERLVIAGELHVKTDGRRCRVGDLSSALGGGDKAEVSRLCFAAFDILPAENEPIPSYADRLERIRAVVSDGKHLSVAKTFEVASSADVQKLYDEHVVSGKNEGLVVRTRDGMIYKVKPSHTIDAIILGYTVKTDAPESARSVVLGLIREDNTTQILGACGNLGSDDERKALMTRLSPLKADSCFRYASDSGSLYTFVKPEVVAEIKVTDLQAEKSDGAQIKSMMLKFDGQLWSPIRPMPGVSPLHPVLVRLRTDKKADSVDARFSQVEDWIARKPDAATQGELPISTPVRREVWKKETKGKVAVRKLIVWKTNKEIQNPAFPAYVIHWTDYSAGRGTPLDREVRLAMEESAAMQIAEKMIADNIKKGWDKVG